jgi:hypothetical protein
MRLGDEISKEEFVKMKEAIENQIVGIQISGNEVKTDEFNIQSDLEYARQFLKNIARQWQDMNVDQKQRLQKRIFPNGIIYDKSPGNYGTAVLSPVFTLSKTFTGRPSDLVAEAGIEPASRAYGAPRETIPSPPR